MKIKGIDFIEGIKKAKGVVGEGDVIEHLRGFVFNPRENGVLDIAGSDGRITLLVRVPYEATDVSDGSVLSVSSDKLQELVKYLDVKDDIEIAYEEGKEGVWIRAGNYRFDTYKKEFENEFINFNVIDEDEFDDVLDKDEVVFILESLIKIARVDSPDFEHQTIYMDGESAHIFEGSVLAKIQYETLQKYVIDSKSAKQILMLLKNSESEKVGLKYYDESYTTLIRTKNDILTFRVFNPDFPDISFADDFNKEAGFTVNRAEFVNSLLRTRIASYEDEVLVKVSGGKMNLKGVSDIERACDLLEIADIEGGLDGVEFEMMVERCVDLCGTIRTKDMKVYLDLGGEMARFEDTSGRVFGMMGINIV